MKYIYILVLYCFMFCGSISNINGQIEKYNLSNEDVKWQGTYTGLTPILSGGAQNIKVLSKEDRILLCKYLNDPNRFVIAHIILTNIEMSKFSTSGSQWNGLSLSLKSNNHVEYSKDSMNNVKNLWAKYFKNK